MEDVDDEIPMILPSNTKPHRMKKAARLFHENLASGSGAKNVDQVNVTYREPEHRQMSMTLTMLTLVVLVSTLVFLVLFLMVPLFYNLNHPLHLDAGEPQVERGHSHSSDGEGGEHAGHGGMMEGEQAAAAADAGKMANMANEKMNSEWIQRISEICQCFAKLVENDNSQSAMKITTATVEICLRSCFSSASTTVDPRSPATYKQRTMQRTEPMHIGSPTSSSGRHQNPFLPPFLMGNSSYSSPLTPNSKAWSIHPSPVCSSLNRSSANQNSTIFGSADGDLHQDVNVPAKSPRRRMNGGPPVKGLFESLPSCGTLPFKLENNDSHLSSAGRSHQLSAAFNDSQPFNHVSSVMSSSCDYRPTDQMRRASSLSHLTSLHDSYSFQGEPTSPDETVDETWVTIFGFPTTTESFILQEFSSFGNIVRHLVPPEGNWMHVQFQNKIQARKALSRHCRVLPGNIMIGVKQCVDKAVLDLNKENFRVTMKATCMNSPPAPIKVKTGFEDLHQSSVQSSVQSPVQSSVQSPVQSPVQSSVQSSSIRHLASGTQAHLSPAGLMPKGIVSNAIGYIFGF